MSQTNVSWMKPSAETKKLALIGKNEGDVMDTYLWYVIGDIRSLTGEEMRDIANTFFAGGRFKGGDIELHTSVELPGNPRLLRVRGRVFLRVSLTLRERYCPLYQVGYTGLNPSSEEKAAFDFHTLWNAPGFQE